MLRLCVCCSRFGDETIMRWPRLISYKLNSLIYIVHKILSGFPLGRRKCSGSVCLSACAPVNIYPSPDTSIWHWITLQGPTLTAFLHLPSQASRQIFYLPGPMLHLPKLKHTPHKIHMKNINKLNTVCFQGAKWTKTDHSEQEFNFVAFLLSGHLDTISPMPACNCSPQQQGPWRWCKSARRGCPCSGSPSNLTSPAS